MRYRFLFVFCLPICAFSDQVTLKNGEVVKGEIISKDAKEMVVKSEFLGEVKVPWTAVVSVTAEKPVTVVLPDGRSVQGTVSTREADLEVHTATGPVSAPLPEVTAIRNEEQQRQYERLLTPAWTQLWAGYLDFGISGARGNSKTSTVTTAFNAVRATNTDKTEIHATQIYSKATVDDRSAITARAVRGGWSYSRGLTDRVLLNVFNDYEFDSFQNLDFRFVGGGGLGYSVIKTDRIRLDLPFGLAYNRENFSTGLTRNSAEGYWGDEFSYKLTSISSIRQLLRVFHNISEGGQYRVNFDLGADTSLNRWLSWQVSVSDRYLSNPVFGRRRNDILYTSGFRVSFAR